MDWYKIVISLDGRISGAVLFYQEKIMEYWRANMAPSGFKILIEKSSDERILYFSPEIVAICKDFLDKENGTACYAPDESKTQRLLNL